MRQFVNVLIFTVWFLVLASSCTTLKPYERVYINDEEMIMGSSPNKKFLHYTHTIREGSVPAQGQKGNGGCGCN
jgi:hypothetical protein